MLFSDTFSDLMVLQRAPQQAAVFGTATPGASVVVQLHGPGVSFTSPPATVQVSADPSLDGSWKVVLPARPAGFAYEIVATCTGCSNATSQPASLSGVGFGDVCASSSSPPALARGPTSPLRATLLSRLPLPRHHRRLFPFSDLCSGQSVSSHTRPDPRSRGKRATN